jgi:sugar O-acyltransferase (sialic acid O-acetyltransferase NeuD family)
MASLLRHVLTHDGGRTVAAFTADPEHVRTAEYEGLPLVPFDELERSYPPSDYDLMISVGFNRINGLRRERFEQGRARGYRLPSYVSSRAIVFPDLEVGPNCVIHEGAIVQSHARLGENVLVRSGANIGHHAVVGSHAFIATGVITGGTVRIGEQAMIGVGAVLREEVTIGERALVGAGAVVLKDVEPDSVYAGNPARRLPKSSLEATGGLVATPPPAGPERPRGTMPARRARSRTSSTTP